MSQNFDFGWLVGMIEGEGCFSVSPAGRGEVQVSGTDEDTMRRFLRLARTGRLFGPYSSPRPNHKPIWRYRATGPQAVELAQRVLPHLSERRSERARHMLAMDARRRGHVTGERVGTAKLTVHDVREIRRRRTDGESGVVLAEEYGVAFSTIYRAADKTYWPEVV